jgi:DNA-binding transcriptional ArsR family regulator
MPLVSPLPDPVVVLIAERFRVIGEPMRIRILDRLRAGESSVQDLVDALETSQQNVSKHLAVLHRAGIVGRRKDGLHSYYRITDDSVFAMCETVCGALQRDSDTLTAALKAVTR